MDVLDILQMKLDHIFYWITTEGSVPAGVGAFCLIGIAALYFVTRGHNRRLEQSRKGYSVESFVQEMCVSGCASVVAMTVYEYLQREQKIQFPIRPEDQLFETLGLTEETLGRTLDAVLAATNRKSETGPGTLQVCTVEELVRFIDACPQTLDYIWERQTALQPTYSGMDMRRMA